MLQESIATTYATNTFFIKYLLGKLTNEDLELRTGQSNNIDWILGHLLLGRAEILQKLGVEITPGDTELKYARGKEKTDKAFLNLEGTIRLLEERGNKIAEIITNLSAEEFEKDIDIQLPDGSKSLYKFVKFLAWHETFHIGQIDLIFAANGKGGIK